MPEEGGRRWQDFFETKLGRFVLGFIKLSMASLLISLINSIPRGSDPQIGNVTIPVGTILTILIAFAPVLLLVSALKDMDVF